MSSVNELVLRNSSLVKSRAQAELQRPTVEQRKHTISKTKQAIDKLIALKSGDLKPNNSPKTVTYEPAGANSSSYALKIVNRKQDPLEPPRQRYKKQLDLTPVSEENRAPILRPPARKLSADEKKQWQVPPCFSNWKNDRGFLIDANLRAAAKPMDAKFIPKKRRRDLVSALSVAADEIAEEQHSTAQRTAEQQAIRQRLLEQKKEHSEAKEKSTDNMFDTRLFHSSKRRQEFFDGSMFSSNSKPIRSKRIHFEK